MGKDETMKYWKEDQKNAEGVRKFAGYSRDFARPWWMGAPTCSAPLTTQIHIKKPRIDGHNNYKIQCRCDSNTVSSQWPTEYHRHPTCIYYELYIAVCYYDMFYQSK